MIRSGSGSRHPARSGLHLELFDPRRGRFFQCNENLARGHQPHGPIRPDGSRASCLYQCRQVVKVRRSLTGRASPLTNQSGHAASALPFHSTSSGCCASPMSRLGQRLVTRICRPFRPTWTASEMSIRMLFSDRPANGPRASNTGGAAVPVDIERPAAQLVAFQAAAGFRRGMVGLAGGRVADAQDRPMARRDLPVQPAVRRQPPHSGRRSHPEGSPPPPAPPAGDGCMP